MPRRAFTRCRVTSSTPDSTTHGDVLLDAVVVSARHVDAAVGADRDGGQPLPIAARHPLREKPTGGVEPLDAVTGDVGHEHIAVRVRRHTIRPYELGAADVPTLEEHSIRREHLHASPPICDVHVAVRISPDAPRPD